MDIISCVSLEEKICRRSSLEVLIQGRLSLIDQVLIMIGVDDEPYLERLWKNE